MPADRESAASASAGDPAPAPLRVRSALPGLAWPAVTRPDDATALALQYGLQHSQWLAPARLQELQFRQLAELLGHAWASVPFYRWRWHGHYDPDAPLTADTFSRLPVLTRSELQEQFEALKSSRVPAAHGQVGETRTSGSTGRPVRTLSTDLTNLWWRVVTLRDHLWHRRDFDGRLAAIRHRAERAEGEGWGPATGFLACSGRAATLPVSVDIASQLDWVEREQPDYLMTYPSSVAELARLSLARGVRLARLREVRTFGEALGAEVAPLVRQAWGVPVTDLYSANEVGYIALQCPVSGDYHVQSETVLVEVLDASDRPVPPGASGRVVITALHNFALPLVRYDVGDYARCGGPCACGRGLPVLERIHGRVRNTLVLANGERYWPSFGQRGFTDIAPVLQHKFVQRDYSTLEAQLVTARPLTAAEEERLRAHILAKLPGSLRLAFVYRSDIPRSASGKFEDFESDVAGGTTEPGAAPFRHDVPPR